MIHFWPFACSYSDMPAQAHSPQPKRGQGRSARAWWIRWSSWPGAGRSGADGGVLRARAVPVQRKRPRRRLSPGW